MAILDRVAVFVCYQQLKVVLRTEIGKVMVKFQNLFIQE